MLKLKFHHFPITRIFINSSLFTVKRNLSIGRALNYIQKPTRPLEEIIKEAKEPSQKVSTAVEPKKSIWQRIKHEAVHYWQGIKLLGVEISISSRLLVKLLNGVKLNRIEQRQLKRTTTDLLRLVPFLIIVLIPFLELALPLLLRFFPNMLPSTFQSKFQEEEKRRKLLKMRLQMASFLQETVAEASLSGTSRSEASKEFSNFFQKCRSSSEPVATEEILKISKKFPDELTLNNLSRPQLVSMAKYMNLHAFGSDAFLRSSIERRLSYLFSDDQMIAAEGVENLSMPELIQICQSRGIRTIGVSPARMRSEVSQWIELHLKHRIPSSLLILSRAFQLSERVPASDQEALQGSAEALQATLSSLPHQMVNEAQLKVSEAEGVATYKQKLDVIKEQEELIEDELEQEATQKALEQEKKTKDAAIKENLVPNSEISVNQNLESSALSNINIDSNVKQNKTVVTAEEDKLSGDELKKLGEALKSMTKESALDDVKEKVADLKKDRMEFQQDIQELSEVTQKVADPSVKFGARVDKMISKIEKELSKYDSEIGSKLNVIRPDESGNISISDLEEALKVIRDHPNDERIQKIVKTMDSDGDGYIALKEVLKLVDEAEKNGEVTSNSNKNV